MAMLADPLSASITLLGKGKGRTATPSGLSEVMRQAARPRPRGRVPQPPVLRPHRREERRHLQGHRDPARRVAPAPLSTVRAPPPLRSQPRREIGRASCRERGCQYGLSSVVAELLKTNKTHKQIK